MGAYLFAHFDGTESSENHEQIYFSVSENGSDWVTLNQKLPILTSNLGEKGVRDPFIIKSDNGKYFVIATDLSIYHRRNQKNCWKDCQIAGSKSLVVWESDDLIHWSDATLVEVADKNAGCTWAPEAVYDNEKNAFMVFWASKVSDDDFQTQRIYRSYTKDFKTFTKAEVYIDGGEISNIDTTITSYNGVYYRFTKNESKSSVTMMKAISLDGPWADVESYTINGKPGNSVTGYEGPTLFKYHNEEKWCLLLDYFSHKEGYKPFITTDISKGEFVSADNFNFDSIYRHGTTMPINDEEYNALVKAFPTK